MNFNRNFKLTSLCLLILLSLSLLCKKEPNEDYLEPVNVSGEWANASEGFYPPSLAIDSKGTLHLVWTDDTTGGNENILYAIKPKNEAWSKPVRVAYCGRFPFIAVDKNDVVHFTWQQFATLDTINHISGWVICYKYKENDKDWSQPETLFWNLLSSVPSLTVDDQGNVHLVWNSGIYIGNYRVTYAKRNREGVWTMPTVLSVGKYPFIYTTGNLIHLFFWNCDDTLLFTLQYIFCSPAGNWSNPETIYTRHSNISIRDPHPFTDEEGNINLYWISTENGFPIYYSKRDASGKWSRPLSLFSANTFCIFLNSVKEFHLVWEKRKVFLHSQKFNEEWTVPDTIRVKDLFIYGGMKGVIDADDTFHLVWNQFMGSEKPKEIYYVSFKR